MKSTPPPVNIATTEIGKLLGELERGSFAPRVDAELERMVRGSEEFGGKGKLVIELEFETKFQKGTVSTTIFGTVKAKVPQADPKPTVRWFKEGRVLGDDPNQGELDFENETGGVEESETGEVVVNIQRGRRRA